MGRSGEDDVEALREQLVGPGVVRADRNNLGRFERGHPGRGGRPVAAVTRALRRLVDPEAIARELLAMAGDRGLAPRDRLMALGMVYDRLEGKVPQAVALDARVQSVTAALPIGWENMRPTERHAFLDKLVANPAMLALAAGSDDDGDVDGDEEAS